jgi:hypothetical protein
MSDNPFMTRGSDSGRKAEKHLARRIKGDLQPASGAIASAKGDLTKKTSSATFLIENKTTVGSSMSLKQEWTHKIYQEALEVNKLPALAFQFVRPNGTSEKKDRWVAVPETVFLELIGD